MKLNEAQFAHMIADMTKQVLKESMGIDPEVGADEYEEQQNYFRSPEGDGMPMDNLSDEDVSYGLDFLRGLADEDLNPTEADNNQIEDHDDWLGAESETPESTPMPGTDDMEEPEFGSEPKEPNFGEDDEMTPEQLQEKQDRLLSFITENWNNHANNLLK